MLGESPSHRTALWSDAASPTGSIYTASLLSAKTGRLLSCCLLSASMLCTNSTWQAARLTGVSTGLSPDHLCVRDGMEVWKLVRKYHMATSAVTESKPPYLHPNSSAHGVAIWNSLYRVILFGLRRLASWEKRTQAVLRVWMLQ